MYMFLFAALILLGWIAYLINRERKRRAQWQLEYRYLTRHHSEQNGSVTAHTSDLDAAPAARLQDAASKHSSIGFNTINSGRQSMTAADGVSWSSGDDAQPDVARVLKPSVETTTTVTEAMAESTTASPWRDRMGASQRGVARCGQHSLARWRQFRAVLKRQQHKFITAIAAARSAQAVKQATRAAATQAASPPVPQTTVADAVSSMTGLQPEKTVNMVKQTPLASTGYALLGNAAADELDDDDVTTANAVGADEPPMEITLAEIEAGRERLQLPTQGNQLAGGGYTGGVDDDKQTIELADVVHVIEAIKADPAVHHSGRLIDDDGVTMAYTPPNRNLEVIELNWTPRQSEYARQMGMGKKRATISATEARNVNIGRSSFLGGGSASHHASHDQVANTPQAELEIIELPYATTARALPKNKPLRQTIVMTEQGLETINEFGHPPIASRAMHQRPVRVETNNGHHAKQERDDEPKLIADDDIRANLLRQRLARRRDESQRWSVIDDDVAVIPEAEVLANLAKTNSPINRLHDLNKPRTTVRDSVIPPTVRIGSEHGFKVKPEAPLNQPLFTRFTPHQHAELTPIATAMASNEMAEPSAGLAPLNHIAQLNHGLPSLAALQAAAAELNLHPQLNSADQKAEQEMVWPSSMASAEESAQASDTFFDWDESQIPSAVDLNEVPPLTRLVSANRDKFAADYWLEEDNKKGEQPLLSLDLAEDDQAAAGASEIGVVPRVAMPEATVTPAVSSVMAAPRPETASRLAGLGAHGWILPNLELLQAPIDDSDVRPDDELLINNGIIIEEKLAEFKVNVKVTDAYAGPVITRYEIEPATGVRGSQVVNLEKDLARSLGFASIRVVETIPGKTCMGLELPNPKRQMISLASVFQAPVFQESKSKLTLVLGQDISGNPVVTDLAKAPHLLVAGTTGSGKSVGVNAMILSMLFKATPEEVRMIMIDPKMLELSIYEGIPHLLAPVVTDMKLAANALNWCVNEMEKRYRLMSHMGVRNLAGYNQKIAEANLRGQRLINPFSITPDEPDLLEKLPFIVVVVDEFADLMMTAGKKIEELIARLAQKARAAGIHLILATQRPSVDVITGLIKANIPTRIAFQVSSKIDSRTILDQMGAENLLGQGDMLFLPPGTGYPRRVHGAFVADAEVHNVVEYWQQFGAPDYIDDILSSGSVDDGGGSGNAGGNEDDPLYDQAVKFVVSSGKTSISAVQRQMRIGYNRAARLVDQMEAAGVLSAPEHNGNRSLLVPQRDI